MTNSNFHEVYPNKIPSMYNLYASVPDSVIPLPSSLPFVSLFNSSSSLKLSLSKIHSVSFLPLNNGDESSSQDQLAIEIWSFFDAS